MIKDSIRTGLDELYKQYVQTFENEQVVLGEGCTDSPVVIVGEAPGKDEVAQGKPFVGAAGKNLMEFMDLIGLTRESVYITNAIKYRLGKLNKKTNRIVNRPATKKDIISNQQWLHNELILLRPKLVVTLGNVPLKAVTNNFQLSIGDVHGRLSTCCIGDNTYKLFPLYHPASIIYNQKLKEIYNKDILLLSQIINEI